MTVSISCAPLTATITVPGHRSRICFASQTPSKTGMITSEKTICTGDLAISSMAASAPGTVSTSCPHCVKRRDRMSRIGASSSTTRIHAITVHRIFVRTAVFSHRCLDYTSGKERLDPFFQHHGNFEVSARVEVAVVHFGFVGAFGEHFSVAELHFDAVSPLFGDFNRIAPIYAGRRFEPRTRFGVDDR